MLRMFGLMVTPVLMLAASTAEAQLITLNPGEWSSSHNSVRTFTGGYFDTSSDDAKEDITELPSLSSLSVSAGNSHSRNIWDLSDDGFYFTIEQQRTGSDKSYAEGSGVVQFIPTEDVDYALSGTYSAEYLGPYAGNLPTGVGRKVYLSGRLLRQGQFPNPGEWLLISEQTSLSTGDESFTLGESGGDSENVSQGSLTGTLLAGQAHIFQWYAYLQAVPDGEFFGDTTATGFVSLDFFPIPEPRAPLLQLSALGALAALVRQNGRKEPQ